MAIFTEYVLTDTLEPGKKYLVANGNNGGISLLSNVSGGSRILTGVQTVANNNKVLVSSSMASSCAFDCILYTSGNDITTTLVSNGSYLYSDGSTGLRFQSTDSLNRYWHYIGTKFWMFQSSTDNGYTDTTDTYKYYLEWDSSGNYTDNHVGTTSIENSTLPAIYLFEETSNTVEILNVKLKEGSDELQPVPYMPIGAIYMSTVSTSPATYFGGTWTQITDRFLRTATSSGGTGGEATHVLTEAELPSHNHTFRGRTGSGTSTATKVVELYSAAGSTTTAYTDYTGGTTGHENMPPYLVVYIWRRTA